MAWTTQRLLAVSEIGDLVARYAAAVDDRDLELLVSLFVPDVRVGRERRGRHALRQWYEAALASVGVTVHFLGNHTIDLTEDGRATGKLYCREEVQDRSGAWRAGMLRYRDDYVFHDGAWLFVQRRVERFYEPLPMPPR